VHGALAALDERGIDLEREDRADLVRKLMVITCSDQGNATPVLNI
jgi:hypothetical protein